jgi:hypothetical protein
MQNPRDSDEHIRKIVREELNKKTG